MQRSLFLYSSHDAPGSGGANIAAGKSVDAHASHGGHSSHAEGVEPDRVQTKMFLVLLVLLVVSLIGVFVAVCQLMWFSVSKVQNDVDLAVANPALAELRAKEEKALNTYGVIDENTGVFQIPIDRAIEIYVKRSNTQGQ